MARNGQEIDVSIGGVGFRLATDRDIPQSIETIPIRKEQFDAETEPGEQSLSGWWRRSQDSFHGGAGNLYQEPRDSDLVAFNGFYTSSGVVVFRERGQVELGQLLTDPTATGYRLRWSSNTTGSRVSKCSGGLLYVFNSFFEQPTTNYSSYFGTGDYVHDGFQRGSLVYALTNDGDICRADESTPTTITRWPLTGHGTAGSVTNRLYYMKHRLWAFHNNMIWAPDLSTAGGTAQAAIYTHPDSSWIYTSAAEGPTSVYFAGHNRSTSVIQAITLDSAGAIPTLSGARTTVELPVGELVYDIAVNGGQWMGIATSAGFRVGHIESDGSVTFGPIIIPGAATGNASAGVAVWDKYFIVSMETGAAPLVAYIVDISKELSDGVFPYAEFASVSSKNAGFKNMVVDQQGRLAGSTSTSDIYVGGTTPVTSGYLETGRIRFRTTEKKLFKYIEVTSEPLPVGASIDVVVEDDSGTASTVGSLSGTGAISSGSLAIPNLGPQTHVRFKFTLNKGTSAGPTLTSYLVKALPSVKPQRLITLPLLCYDFETGKSGQKIGKAGNAKSRYDSLTSLENVGDTITLIEYGLSETSSTVVIDSLRFVQTATPPPGASGKGGILIVQLRTAEA